MNFDLGSDSAISDILRDVPIFDELSKKSRKLGLHVHALEEEMKKVEAFKRELPHCMHLLRDGLSLSLSFEFHFTRVMKYSINLV